MKSELYKCGRLLCAYPYDPKLRGSYYKKLKQYTKQCKCEYRRFKSGIVNMFGQLQSNNPKQYWKLVEDITNTNQPKTCVAVENLYEHYKNLNSDNVSSTNNRVYIEDRIRELEKVQNFTPQDFIITNTEISKSISKLKNGKVPGFDLIKNQMLKSGAGHLLRPLAKVFKMVLRTGYYPPEWSKGRIVSIHKKGDPSDPANYRGITITGSLGKLFILILNSRLS